MLPKLTRRRPRVRAGYGIASAILAALLFAVAVCFVTAAPAGLQVRAAEARSEVVTRRRIALLTVTQPATVSRRAADAHADEEAIAKRLREIGFEVWTIGPASRPELARTLRDAVGRIPEDAEVAVMPLGQTLGGGDDIFLVPAGSALDLATRADLLDTEGLRLADLLRRLAERRPRELVAVLDECRPVSGGHCPLDATVGASGASLVAAERIERPVGGSPLAAQVSLREALLDAMAPEGQSFLRFFETLGRRLERSDLAPLASSRLSASFAFVPARFFAGLGTECGRVDPNADVGTIRGLSLDPLIRACEAEVAARPYATWFALQRDAVREQRAFQRATTSCGDRAAASLYRSAYPAGRFLPNVDLFAQDCDRRAQEQRDQRQREEARDQQRRQEEENQRRRDQAEQEASRRAMASCDDRSGASAYLAAYPTGRFRSNVESFLRTCDRDRDETERRRRDEEQRRRDQVEQEAYGRAVASCGDKQSAAAYLATYPGGRFRGAVESFLRICDRPDQRLVMTSRTGWRSTYSSRLLHIEQTDDDQVNTFGLITTYLKPNWPGDGKVDFFIQTGENKECQSAEAWAQRVLARNRPQVTGRETLALGGQRAFFQEGSSFRGDPAVSFMDVVIIPFQDPNMFVHIGVQFPAADQTKWRDEFIRALAAFQITPTAIFRGRCRG